MKTSFIYDFTSILDRRGKDAIAVDLESAGAFAPKGATLPEFDRIPMWVADMNFPVVPTIQEEIIRRAQHPAFGYYAASDEYYNSIINWQETRNSVTGLAKENIGYENGVLGGVVSALNVLSSKGDNVLLHSPTYIGFTGSLTNNGYHIVHSPLKRDEQGIFRMDFADMEEKIRANHIHTAVFCSPHNPTGRVWERGELEDMFALFERYQVSVISDEIWSDLTLNGYRHIPVQSVSDYARNHTVALYAPSKTFNLAGLIGSYHIIYDEWLNDRVKKESSLSHYNDMNVLSMHALIGAYKPEGHVWLDELKEVLTDNIDFASDFFLRYAKGVSFMKPQGTYMLFLDFGDWCKAHNMSIDELQETGRKYGVIWQDGRPFGGDATIRMNFALPRSRVEEALNRLRTYIFT